MALNYRDIKTKRLWKSSTGLSEEQFHILSSMFKETYESFFNETLEDKIAQSTSEVRFKTYEDLLFFGLYSLKTDLSYDLLGLSFSLSASNAYENQAVFLAVLEDVLCSNNCLPKRSFKNEKEFKEYISSKGKILIDVTEQRVQRSASQELQKLDYSGKKNAIPPKH